MSDGGYASDICHCLQGLADTFIILGMPFDSPEAKQLNKDIFECIYYNALVTSSALAKVHGKKSLFFIQCLGTSSALAWSSALVQFPDKEKHHYICLMP